MLDHSMPGEFTSRKAWPAADADNKFKIRPEHFSTFFHAEKAYRTRHKTDSVSRSWQRWMNQINVLAREIAS